MWVSIGAYVKKPPIFKPMYYDVECCDITPDNSTSSYFSSTTDFYTTSTTTVPEVYDLLTYFSKICYCEFKLFLQSVNQSINLVYSQYQADMSQLVKVDLQKKITLKYLYILGKNLAI